MGLRSLVHVAGGCLCVLLGSSVANAALLAGPEAIGSAALEPVSLSEWATPSTAPGPSGQAPQAQIATWVARPDGTAGGMQTDLFGWSAVADSTSGLHMALGTLRVDDAPVPLPATFWLFGSGLLAAMLTSYARQPAATGFPASRRSRAR